MKRLVVAGDGTWNGLLGNQPSNVEKFARTIELDPARSGGVPQVVLYVAGVGTAGDRWDRVVGGAFGGGLNQNLMACYRFLCANYLPGDEMYIVGFSRGAYMVRSLVSMVCRFGLLSPYGIVRDKLPEVLARYRDGSEARDSETEFRRDWGCTAPIRFLGAFDTVGEVGWSGMTRRVESFHDMRLHPGVTTARQALSIDERRMKFAPWVWNAGTSPEATGDVRQVWFEGDHSDVGGGRRMSGLSDITLLWLAGEASRCGLVFDWNLLAQYVDSRESRLLHSTMNPLWWTGNAWRSVAGRRRSQDAFLGRRRRLLPDGGLGLRVAESTLERYREHDYQSPSLAGLEASGTSLDGMTEPLFQPVRARKVLVEELRAWAQG